MLFNIKNYFFFVSYTGFCRSSSIFFFNNIFSMFLFYKMVIWKNFYFVNNLSEIILIFKTYNKYLIKNFIFNFLKKKNIMRFYFNKIRSYIINIFKFLFGKYFIKISNFLFLSNRKTLLNILTSPLCGSKRSKIQYFYISYTYVIKLKIKFDSMVYNSFLLTNFLIFFKNYILSNLILFDSIFLVLNAIFIKLSVIFNLKLVE